MKELGEEPQPQKHYVAQSVQTITVQPRLNLTHPALLLS